MARKRMDPHTEAVMSLRSDVDTLRNEMEQRFDAVDRRLDAVDRRLDAMDRRFDAMDRRFDAMDQRIDETSSGLRALIESVHSDLRLLLDHFSPALTQITRHELRLGAHDERFDGL
ncbi:MAG: hypothetical protein ACRD26_18230 [Vicinamibacterales bacterium]